MIKRLTLCLVVAMALTLGALPAAQAAPQLMMATTTSTDDTGLLNYLAPEFQKDTGIELKWTATGTGKALELGKNCDVDVVLVHAPEAEKKWVAEGNGLDRRQVMYNDFVILGPRDDPAGLKGKSVAEALGQLAQRQAVFVSRGDKSGTHILELALWKGLNRPLPDKEPWYVQTGQGMLQTIRVAEEKKGYTLSDRGTFIKYDADHHGHAPLAIVVEGDKSLLNQYAVIPVNPQKCPKVKIDLARKFSDWLVSPKGQKVIGGFLLQGKPLFTPNAQP